MIDILIIFSDESDTEEIANINRHGAQSLAAPVAREVILEDISGSIVSLSAMTYRRNQNPV
jgi:hypothetical protein